MPAACAVPAAAASPPAGGWLTIVCWVISRPSLAHRFPGAVARQHGRDNRPGSGPGQIKGVINFT